MRTVQLTIDEDLVKEVDALAGTLGTTRSAFTREALRAAIERIREGALERKHREGYRRKPVRPKEFAAWERAQDWGAE
jgi:metal-responsive CopG/Arc/MetJ family transcriptional regulator